MHTVLHIMPHMGPGVGKAVSALSITAKNTDSMYQHRILLLEKPRDLYYITICKDNDVDVSWPHNKQELVRIISEADIVQLEWWHHPLVLGFLRKLSQIPVRPNPGNFHLAVAEYTCFDINPSLFIYDPLFPAVKESLSPCHPVHSLPD